MKLSLIVAVTKNNVIGNGLNIPWNAKGEQLLFKALTFNQWILVGRKTFESMGILENRKYIVITNSKKIKENENLKVFNNIDKALEKMEKITNHIIISGGGIIYNQVIDKVDTIHISTIDTIAKGNVKFPKIPENFRLVFEQNFKSNIDYKYQIWKRER